MMHIRIGEYALCLHSNGRCFVLGRIRVRGDGSERPGETYVTDRAYYPTIQSLLKALPNRMALDSSEANTLSELWDEFQRYHKLIEKEWTAVYSPVERGDHPEP